MRKDTEMAKGNLIINNDWNAMFQNLPDDKAGQLIKALLACHNGVGTEIDDPVLSAVFEWIKVHPTKEERPRNTPEYRRFRKDVLNRDGYTCQICGCQKRIMHVHHIKPFAFFANLRTDPDNGITLCPECHREVHHNER